VFYQIKDIYQGIGARQGGIQVSNPQTDTPIPKPARHEHTRGGTAKLKQAVADPPTEAVKPPMLVKHATQLTGPL
jgi:hypothetical protein